MLRVPVCFDDCEVHETAESDAAFAASEFDACERQWQTAIQRRDVDTLWRLWTSIGEAVLCRRYRATAPKYRGRGLAPRVVRRPQFAAQCSFHGESSAVLLAYARAERLFAELARVHWLGPESDPFYGAALHRNLDALLQNEGLDELHDYLAAGTPEACRAAAAIAGSWRAAEAQRQAGARRKAWRDWVQDAVWHSQRALFKWCRGERPPEPLPVQAEHGESLDPADLAVEAARQWGGIWGQPHGSRALPWRAWHVPEAADELPPLDGFELQRLAQHLGDRKAGGRSGWRVREYRSLPMPCWHRLVQLYDVVERIARWPTAIAGALFSLIPKEGKRRVQDLRDIGVLDL
eukprot:3954262-Lingulodinium_polyedra.AAC.1